MACHYFIEDFDCKTTSSDKCIQALRVRLQSDATSDAERKKCETCAQEIAKKDAYLGANAQALLQQARETGTGTDEICFFNNHLPNYKFETWDLFVRKDCEKINAFKLCRFIKERWGLTKHEEKLTQIDDVEKIVNLVESVFPKQKKQLSKTLKIVRSDFKQLRQKIKEDDVRAIINKHIRTKQWITLKSYIEDLNTTGFSYDLITLITQAQEKAGKGVAWLQRRNVLDQLVEKSESMAPDLLYLEYRDTREDVRELVARQEEMADSNNADEVRERMEQLEENILRNAKKWQQPAGVIYSLLKQWEEEFITINSEVSYESETYVNQLSMEILEDFSKKVFNVLETGNGIEEIQREIHGSLDEIAALGLKDRLDDFVFEGQEESIREILRQVDDWIVFNDNLERTFRASDPFRLTVNLEQQPEDLERASGLAQHTAALVEIKRKYQACEEVLYFTRTTVELLQDLVKSLCENTQRILYNKPDLKLEGFGMQFKTIRDQILQVLETHREHYEFVFLGNLEQITRVLQQILFNGDMEQLKEEENSLLEENKFLKSISEFIANGSNFVQELEQLNPGSENNAKEEPPALQDRFFSIIEDYRQKAILFPRCRVKEVTGLYESVMEMMHSRIDSYLEPARSRLNFPFPLLSENEREELSLLTSSLLTQVNKIDSSYPGFEELVDPYKDELELLSHLLAIHDAVQRKDFQQADNMAEQEFISDPDIRYPFQVLVYYHRHLKDDQWKEEEWLNFFQRFSLDSLKMNEIGYNDVLSHYRKDTRKNFQLLELSSVTLHRKVFKTFFPGDDLLPYLRFLEDDGDVETFLKDLQTPVRADAFKGMVTLLEKNELWPKYIGLYRQATAKNKKFFDKPLEKAKKQLKDHYEELVKLFKQHELKQENLEEYEGKIPGDTEFHDYQKKVKRLRDLSQRMQNITVNFKNLESYNIWEKDDFQTCISRDISDHVNKFTGDFSGVKGIKNWQKRISNLRAIYDRGRELKQQMEKFKENDSGEKGKEQENYSKNLEKDIKEILSRWNRLIDELAAIKENEVIKANYQHYYFDYFLGLWQKMSLFDRWEEAGKETPGSLVQFFGMWQKVLDNHEAFMTIYHTEDNLQQDSLDDIEVLDEFIRLAIERWEQQGKFKHRGEV